MEPEEGVAAIFLSIGVDLFQHFFDCHLGRSDLCKRGRKEDLDVLNLADHRLVLVVVDACERLEDLNDLFVSGILRLHILRHREVLTIAMELGS